MEPYALCLLGERGLGPLCQQLFDAFSHGCQAEVFRAQFFHGNPQQFGCVVHGMSQATVCHRTAEETIYGMYQKSGIQVSVGQGKQEFRAGYFQPGFFFYFPCHSFLAALETVRESAGQVERAFGRFLSPAADQQFLSFVQDDRDSGCTGVEIVNEAAVFALFRFFVMLHEAR